MRQIRSIPVGDNMEIRYLPGSVAEKDVYNAAEKVFPKLGKPAPALSQPKDVFVAVEVESGHIWSAVSSTNKPPKMFPVPIRGNGVHGAMVKSLTQVASFLKSRV